MGVDKLTREMSVVLRQYNVHPNRIAFFERGFLVTVDGETGWLQPWRLRSDVQRYLTVYRLLHGQNSSLLLPLILTKKRQEAVFTSRRAYTFSRWPEKSTRLKWPQSVQDFYRWGRAIGKLQRQLAATEAASAENRAADATRPAASFPFSGWLETMRQRRQTVLEVRQRWLTAANLPEEERLFVRNVPPMLERIDTAIWILEDLQQRPVPVFSRWTMGDLSDSFLSLPSGEMKLAPWKRWWPGNGLSDLGRLLLLVWEVPQAWEAAAAAVDGFEEEWPLTAEAFQALLAYMMFPHTLWSLVHRALAAQKRPSARVDGMSPDMPRLPIDVEQLREIYRQERQHRPLLAWLNRKIAERRTRGRIVRRLTET